MVWDRVVAALAKLLSAAKIVSNYVKVVGIRGVSLVTTLFKDGWTARFGFVTFLIIPHIPAWNKALDLLYAIKPAEALEYVLIDTYAYAFGTAYERMVTHLVQAAAAPITETITFFGVSAPTPNTAFFAAVAGAVVAAAHVAWFIRAQYWFFIKFTTLDMIPWQAMALSIGIWMLIGKLYTGYFPFLQHVSVLTQIPEIVSGGSFEIDPALNATSGNSTGNVTGNVSSNVTG